MAKGAAAMPINLGIVALVVVILFVLIRGFSWKKVFGAKNC